MYTIFVCLGNMPRLLELFSGTGSVGRPFQEAGWDVISVDICPGFNPTLCENVLDIPLDRWPEGHFDFIWSSPPCTHFSRLQNTAKNKNPEDLLVARRCVIHSLCLIRALRPRVWCVENPATGTLKNESFWGNINLPHKWADVSYCKYSDPTVPVQTFTYRKQTRIWYSGFEWFPKVCRCDCLAIGPKIVSFCYYMIVCVCVCKKREGEGRHREAERREREGGEEEGRDGQSEGGEWEGSGAQ